MGPTLTGLSLDRGCASLNLPTHTHTHTHTLLTHSLVLSIRRLEQLATEVPTLNLLVEYQRLNLPHKFLQSCSSSMWHHKVTSLWSRFIA